MKEIDGIGIIKWFCGGCFVWYICRCYMFQEIFFDNCCVIYCDFLEECLQVCLCVVKDQCMYVVGVFIGVYGFEVLGMVYYVVFLVNVIVVMYVLCMVCDV